MKIIWTEILTPGKGRNFHVIMDNFCISSMPVFAKILKAGIGSLTLSILDKLVGPKMYSRFQLGRYSSQY